MPPEPLLKALAGAGIGSRRKIADAIKQSRVTVNGEVVEDFRHPVNSAADRIAIDGRTVILKARQAVTIMLHKPAGVLSTTRDERGRRTVMNILPPRYRGMGLYPAGRLDGDSTGLLLLTNDGELTYRLTHPKFEHEKEYLVHIKGSLQSDEIRKLERGILLEDGRTSPATLRKVESPPPYNYSLTIHEGRKRQVRRMFARLKHPVLALKRVRMGNLNLGDLKAGGVRELTDKEVKSLLNTT
ncbi:pseudouridine synthase [Chloroflexota bacterium]